MTDRDPIREAHDRRWYGLICAQCGKPMTYEPPLAAWDQDHVEGGDLALVPYWPLGTGTGRTLMAIVVHPECVGEQE